VVVVPLFLALFAARFSLKDMAGFFFASLLLLRSFDMVILRIGNGQYDYFIPVCHCTPGQWISINLSLFIYYFYKPKRSGLES